MIARIAALAPVANARERMATAVNVADFLEHPRAVTNVLTEIMNPAHSPFITARFLKDRAVAE